MEIETLLHKEIADEFKNLAGLDVGTEEYKITVDGIAKLMDRAIEIEKFHESKDEKEKDRTFDHDLKLKQLEAQISSQKDDMNIRVKQLVSEEKDRLIRNCIAVAGIVIPVGVTIWGTLKTFRFEEQGTVTTMIGRGFINKLLPKK